MRQHEVIVHPAVQQPTIIAGAAFSLPAVAPFPISGSSVRSPAHPAHPPYQLQALIEGKPYERNALMELIAGQLKTYNNAILTDVVRYSLIPILEDQVYKFENMELFHSMIGSYLKAMDGHIRFLEKATLSEMIQHEISFQKEVTANPLLQATLTTCGFEYEFLQTTEDSVLAGISHLELAQSKENFLQTKLPFKVETDSSCELELVTPPFLLPTLGTGSLPNPTLVDSINTKFQKGLVHLQSFAHELSKSADMADHGIQGLLRQLSQLLGISIELHPDKIGIHNVSYNIGAKGKKAVREGLKPDDLSQIEFKPKNEKYLSKGIDIAAQINFAASAEVLGTILARMNMKDDLIFAPLYAEWHRYLTSKAPGLPMDYLEHIIQKLVSSYAVPMQKILLRELGLLHGALAAGQAAPGKENQESIEMLAPLISYVKDIKPLWVKDDLGNITKSYLSVGNVATTMKDLRVDDFPYAVLESSFLHMGIPQLAEAINNEYKEMCNLAFATLRTVCIQPYPEVPSGKINFLEHSRLQIGGRQDTYIYLNEISPAKGAERRYIGEVRDGNSRVLYEMAEAIIVEQEASYRDDDTQKDKLHQKIKAEVEERYQKAYKDHLPREKEEEGEEEDPMLGLLGQSDKLLDMPRDEKKSKKEKKEKKRSRSKDKDKKDKV
jgi:hypothetical protein